SLVGVGLIACQTLKAWPDQTPDGEPPRAPAAEGRAHETEKQAPMDRYGDPLPAGAPARLATTRLRHTRHGVTHVRFSPDGKTLASGGSDKTFLGVRGANPSAVRLWDVATGKLLRTLEGHQNAITSLSFSPDGKRLASSGSWDETIRLWDV